MTISEKQFENFCRQACITCKRLLPDGQKSTADYEIMLGGQRIIVEVKEIEDNEADLLALRDFRQKGWAIWKTCTVGNRIRNKIEAAKHQIERLAAGKCPGILLLYDARTLNQGSWSYEILVAMYGFETIDLHVSKYPNKPVHFGTHKFGKGKKLRPDSHIYISAVGMLREADVADQLHIDLYHNVHTNQPLPLADIVTRKDMTVFTVSPGEENEFRGWAKLVAEEKGNKTSAAISE